jgi:hypothetical protein
MAVGSNHVIANYDSSLRLKVTYRLALSKIKYNSGKGQNPFPYVRHAFKGLISRGHSNYPFGVSREVVRRRFGGGAARIVRRTDEGVASDTR